MTGSLIRPYLCSLVLMGLVACDGSGTDAAAPPLDAGVTPLVIDHDLGDPNGPLVIAFDDSASAIPPLIDAGYRVVVFGLPCGASLTCWAQNIHDGDTALFTDYCAHLSASLDQLGVTFARIVGVSREGYVAVACAAHDVRFQEVALQSPVTDLNYLAEFRPPLQVNEAIYGTQQYVQELSTRVVLVRISDQDTRVGTSLAVAFAQQVGALLDVYPSAGGNGHYNADDGTTLAFFQWADKQLQ